MKYMVYLVSGLIFGLGLSISGMIDPNKIKSFLSFGFEDWSPALLFVLGAATPVYMIGFYWIRTRQKTLNGTNFAHPHPRPVDKKLVLGSIIFGLGWGLAGICPGPAIVSAVSFDTSILIFLATMFAGFELQGRLA